MGTFQAKYLNLTLSIRFEEYKQPWNVGIHINIANVTFVIKSVQELDEDGEEIPPSYEDEVSSFCGNIS